MSLPNSFLKTLRSGAAALGILVLLSGCGKDVLGPGSDEGSDLGGDGGGTDHESQASLTLLLGEQEVSFRPESLSASYVEGVFTIEATQPIGANGIYNSFFISVAASEPGEYTTPQTLLSANALWYWDFSRFPDDAAFFSTWGGGASGRIIVESMSATEIRGHFVGSLSCDCEEGNIQASGSFWAKI